MKKSWKKPELTVLVRTRPEEAILGLCKNSTNTGGRRDRNSTCLVIDAGGCSFDCHRTPDS